MTETVTHKRMREVLCYDQETGIFTWIVNRGGRGGKAKKGTKAGCLSKNEDGNSYIRIMIDGRPYLAHRLAWFDVTGRWPDRQIDHIDGDGTNNRFANLRQASNSQNQANRKISKLNRSGFKGVGFHKQTQRWRARIKSGGRDTWIGLFETPQEAYEAYLRAAEKTHGLFARAQ